MASRYISLDKVTCERAELAQDGVSGRMEASVDQDCLLAVGLTSVKTRECAVPAFTETIRSLNVLISC